MDGMHDLGGMHCFGPVQIEKEDYVFQADWQRKSFALAQALAGVTPYCADLHRQEIERIRPTDYLAMDYFDKWTMATSSLLEKAGLVNQQELRTGRKQFDVKDRQAVTPDALVAAMKIGVYLQFPDDPQPAKFKVGQMVRVLNTCKKGHTRVPRYLRGALGTIAEDAGVFQFADAVAAGQGPDQQHCYRVSFSAKLLWGEDAEADDTVNADLWESYLETA
jgi:nitrile hydratase beta subunit